VSHKTWQELSRNTIGMATVFFAGDVLFDGVMVEDCKTKHRIVNWLSALFYALGLIVSKFIFPDEEQYVK
jgi:hypothetical protein